MIFATDVMITHDDRLAEATDRILLIEDGLIHELSKAEHQQCLVRELSYFMQHIP